REVALMLAAAVADADAVAAGGLCDHRYRELVDGIDKGHPRRPGYARAARVLRRIGGDLLYNRELLAVTEGYDLRLEDQHRRFRRRRGIVVAGLGARLHAIVVGGRAIDRDARQQGVVG